MNKTRLISIMLLAMLLTSCVMATVEGVQDYANNKPPTTLTPDETMQGYACLGAIVAAFVVCSLLAKGGGLREIFFSVVILAMAVFLLLA